VTETDRVSVFEGGIEDGNYTHQNLKTELKTELTIIAQVDFVEY